MALPSGACLGQEARQLKNGEEGVVGLGGLPPVEVRNLSLSGPGRAEDDFTDFRAYQKRCFDDQINRKAQ